MAIPEKKLYTPEEYLTFEEQSEERHEYYNGEIYAMSGASLNHNRIVGNLSTALRQAIGQKPCEVLSTDMRLLVQENGLYTYPDLMVICGQVELVPGIIDTATNPTLIVEVLSDSMQEYDRTEKFAFYRQIPSLKEYVLIDQKRAFVEVYRRIENDLWVYEAYNQPDAQMKLAFLDVEIPLSAIYARVEFPEKSEKKQRRLTGRKRGHYE